MPHFLTGAGLSTFGGGGTAVKRIRHLLLLVAVVGCSTMSVKSSFDPASSFGQYRTYAWLPLMDQGHTAQLLRGSPAEQRIKAAVERDLAAKGILPTPARTRPDFVIAYHVMLEEKLNVTDWGYSVGYPYATPALDAYSYTEGTLLIDFIDPNTEQAFWRGTASDVVDDPGSGSNGKIDEAVAKIVEKYPPSTNDIAAAQPQPKM
jgi:hypothetical protein